MATLRPPAGIRSLLVTSLLFLAPAASVHAGPAPGDPSTMFSSFRGFVTGNRPYSVAIGDLNGDGWPELVTPNFNSNTVSVLPGNGDGTFGPKTDFGTGPYPISVAIADLNADGRPDLVTADNGGNNGWPIASVLLGNGDGTFGPKTDYGPSGAGTHASSVVIADLNADGKPDLAVGVGYSTGVSVLLGNGDGTFGLRTDFVTGGSPVSLAIADFNSDGRPDLVTANDYSYTVSVLLGNGDGTFGPHTDFPAGPGSGALAVADLNGDGSLDVAVANHHDNGGEGQLPQYFASVSVLLGHGDGSFAPRSEYVTGYGPSSVAIADLDGDGRLDLATANSPPNNYSSTVSILLGNGAGAFTLDFNFSYGRGAAIVTGDVNTDGYPDLAFTDPTMNSVLVMLHAIIDHAAPTVAITSPIGGESWGANTEYIITWDASDNVGVTSVDLELSTDGGASYPTGIASGIANTGSYMWTTPTLTTSTVRIRVTAHDACKNATRSESASDFTIQQPLSVPSALLEFAVSARPNPVSGDATIEMSVARDACVRLSLVDLQGREVQRFASGVHSAGRYSIRWDGRSNGRQTAAGLYFLRYQTPDRVIVQQFAVTH